MSDSCNSAALQSEKFNMQNKPIPNSNSHITDLVIEDMKKRKEEGIRRYGVPLQAGNGRDALQDAYEEALDLCQYLKQAIEERSNETDY